MLNPPTLQSHLPSLNGMRAVSILLVIGFHSYLACVGDSEYGHYLGSLGVRIFFVISGLLITWLMIREQDATGEFSLPNFYVRRLLRIIPVFWLLILTVIASKLAHLVSVSWVDIVRALTFTQNYPVSLRYHQAYAWCLAHTWSLSVEEQFYLLWPGVFALVPRKYAPRFALVLAISGPILRLAIYNLFPGLRGLDPDGFEYHVDALMAGCASAFLLDSAVWRDRINKAPVWPILAASAIFLLVAEPALLNHFAPHTARFAFVSLTLPTGEACAIAMMLLVLVGGRKGLAFRALNGRIPNRIGKLSYSLYIWQQWFLWPGAALGIFALLWRLAAISLVAYCSFNFIEKPFFNLRTRFRHGVSV